MKKIAFAVHCPSSSFTPIVECFRGRKTFPRPGLPGNRIEAQQNGLDYVTDASSPGRVSPGFRASWSSSTSRRLRQPRRRRSRMASESRADGQHESLPPEARPRFVPMMTSSGARRARRPPGGAPSSSRPASASDFCLACAIVITGSWAPRPCAPARHLGLGALSRAAGPRRRDARLLTLRLRRSAGATARRAGRPPPGARPARAAARSSPTAASMAGAARRLAPRRSPGPCEQREAARIAAE